MRRMAVPLFALAIPCLGGCAFYPKVQNPFPGVFRVAVVDFVNKTNGAEGVDTAKITEIFASELQKIPSYEVVPVQEVREVLGPVRIDTNQPQLAFEVARAMHAQAVIVGAVTEYSAYYPPRIGLHCEMYAMVTGQPEAVVQSPPAVVERSGVALGMLAAPFGAKARAADGPRERPEKHQHKHHGCKHRGVCSDECAGEGKCVKRFCWGWPLRRCAVEEYAAPAEIESGVEEDEPVPLEPVGPGRRRGGDTQEFSPSSLPRDGVRAPIRTVSNTTVEPSGAAEVVHAGDDWSPAMARGAEVEAPTGTAEQYLAGELADYQISVRQAIDPVPVVEPWVIRHSRIFDGTNHGLTRKLKDYYYFQDDLRGGEWQGYVLRNEDFNRFACNRMIYEMLEAAGGNWITLFGMRYAKPWEPWPPR